MTAGAALELDGVDQLVRSRHLRRALGLALEQPALVEVKAGRQPRMFPMRRAWALTADGSLAIVKPECSDVCCPPRVVYPSLALVQALEFAFLVLASLRGLRG